MKDKNKQRKCNITLVLGNCTGRTQKEQTYEEQHRLGRGYIKADN
jgi:hypothetical protein